MYPHTIQRVQALRIAVVVAAEEWHTLQADGNSASMRDFAHAARVSRHRWQKQAARAADLESASYTHPTYSAATQTTPAAAEISHECSQVGSRKHAPVVSEAAASRVADAESRLRQAELVMQQQSSDIASLRMELNRMQRLLKDQEPRAKSQELPREHRARGN